MTASGLELVGMLAGLGAAAVALVARDARVRLAAIGLALIVAPVLVAGDVWDEGRVVRFRDDATNVAAAALVATAAITVLAVLMRRVPQAFPILIFALLPLRVPVEIGGETANLLIPLYIVIAAGTAATVWTHFTAGQVRDGRGGAGESGREPRDKMRPVRREAGSPGASLGQALGWRARDRTHRLPPPTNLLRWALAATLVVYAIQSAYSEDVSNAIENACFFLIPFAVAFVLLAEVTWTRRLLAQVLVAVGAMAALFSLVALYQYAARDLFLNDDLAESNELHIYFRVNSLFYDPNIFGRYLALALTALGAYLAWGSDRRSLAIAAAVAGVIVAGLGLAFSITSFAAALAGLAVLAVLRWRWHGAAVAGSLAAVGLVALLIAGGAPSSDIEDDRGIDSGRSELISGGVELVEKRPAAGWGSGSFGAAFFEQIPDATRGQEIVSHAEPITVAAEQGAAGLLVYLALVALALAVLLGGGLTGSVGRDRAGFGARAAIAACFVAMLVHSLGYAGFAIDPATWALLAIGVALRIDRLD